MSAQQLAGRNIAGMGSLSGTVTAGKPFKAAQVYIRNIDKRILYMVYTNGGQYRAVSLFPGNYEVNVVAKGLQSAVQKLAVKTGDNPNLKLAMRTSPPAIALRPTSLEFEGGDVNRV